MKTILSPYRSYRITQETLMPSKKLLRMFALHGAKAAFAREAGVSRTTVTLWLQGQRPSPRLDQLAREWKFDVTIEPKVEAASVS